MKKEKIKVYTYKRVSTAMQIDGYSLDAQRARMKAYADFNDYEIVGEYEDAGKSGRTLSNLAYFFTSFINASRSFTICSRFPVGPMKYSLPPISSGFPVVLVRTPNVSLLLPLR